MKVFLMAVLVAAFTGITHAADFPDMQAFRPADVKTVPATAPVPAAMGANNGGFSMSCYITGFHFAYNSTEILAKDISLTEKDKDMKLIKGKHGTVFYRVNPDAAMGAGYYTLILRFDKTGTVDLYNAWSAELPYLVVGFSARDERVYGATETGTVSCSMAKAAAF